MPRRHHVPTGRSRRRPRARLGPDQPVPSRRTFPRGFCFPPKPHGLFPTRRASRWWWALWDIHPVGLLPQVSSCQTLLEGTSGGVRPPPRLFHPVRRVARRRRAGAAGRGASAPGSDPAAVSPAGREAGSQAPCGPESPAALPSLPCWDPGAGEPLAWVRPPRDHITRVPGPGGWEEERWARRQQGPGPSAAIRARGPPQALWPRQPGWCSVRCSARVFRSCRGCRGVKLVLPCWPLSG